MRLSRINIKTLIVTIFLISYAVVQLFPLFWMILFSLKSNSEIFGGNPIGIPHEFLWSNYENVLTNGKVGIYFVNSVIVTFVTILISVIASSMVGYAIVRMKWKLSKFVLTLFLVGMMIPIHAVLLPLFIILSGMGQLNSYQALVLPYVAFSLPMSIFILTSFLESIPRELEEAACIDGCNIYQIFFKIVFPLIRPGIATISILIYLQSWNELMFATTFINSVKFKTLTVGIMQMVGEYSTEWGPIGAGLVVATLPTIVIYSFLSKQVQDSLMAGALKG